MHRIPRQTNYLWEDRTNNLTPSQNQNSIKAKLQAAEQEEIYHATNCFISLTLHVYRGQVTTYYVLFFF